jgi:hypothetical protein
MKRSAAFAGATTLVCTAVAYGSIVGLPASGTQVDNDPALNPGQDTGLTDVSAGTVVAGNPLIPWATFSQAGPGGGQQQIFVREFKAGAWQTEGFPESLNVNAGALAQAPSIDFTGANRTVPWVAWAEPNGGANQIFASRFVPQPTPAQNGGQWIHEGQTSTSNGPSLNINAGRNAADPSLIGGTTIAGGNPAPWVAWQEFDNSAGGSPTSGTPQIFVSHAVPAASSGGACPGATKPGQTGRTTSVGNFCFQQVGLDRVTGPAGQTDPSLDIDPTRDGIQSDIAFTGPNDTVPWVVWYENSDSNNSTIPGLDNADMVFAARAVAGTGDGGFRWQVVGLGTAGASTPGSTGNLLDNTNTHGFGQCASSASAEAACALDAAPAATTATLTDGNGGENPQVTAGTMVAGKATTPWITWDESSSNGGLHSVFVARLDAAGDHFDLLNNGQPISHSGLDSTRPDIAFSHNTPYVSWHESNGTTNNTFVGHFEGNPADPVFHIDAGPIPTTQPGGTSDDDLTDVRQPVATTCPANPFTLDGAACPGGAAGTPFFAFTNPVGGVRTLFAQTYQPDGIATGGASGVTTGGATVSGSVNPNGAPVKVLFNFGPTTSYGSSTGAHIAGPSEGATGFSAVVTGSPGSVVHYQAVTESDFGTFAGADQSLRLATPPARFSFRVKFKGLRRRIRSKKFKKITGTASATLGVAKVEIGIVRVTGKVHIARKQRLACRELASNGRLKTIKVNKRGSCTPVLLKAKGTTKWSFTLKHPLPTGKYVIVAVIVDKAHHIQPINSSNEATVTVI